MERIVPILNLSPTPADREAWRVGKYDVTHVDCTAMWNLRTRGDVRSYLRALEMQAKSRHGRPMCRGGTVYFGKHSRRWSLKAYSKGDEVETTTRGHRFPPDIPHRENLLKYADKALRFELVLRSMALRDRGLARASAWENIHPLDLLQHAIEALDMADNFSLTPEILEGLPPRLILVYEGWKSGKDLRQLFALRTFYRYRKELLKRGVDINIKQASSADNVVPLMRALHPEAIAQVPDWAKGTTLYFDPPIHGLHEASN
jgi:II/X family phage/plasmid replication protein